MSGETRDYKNLSAKAQGCKVTGEARHPRMQRMPERFLPSVEMTILSELSVFAPLRETIPLPLCRTIYRELA